MDSLSREEREKREKALWAINVACALRGKGGYSEADIAAKAGFESLEHMRRQFEQWNLPDWFIHNSVPAAQQTTHSDKRKAGPGTHEYKELSSPHRAADLFEERIKYLSAELENLYNSHRYQDKRFAGAAVSPGTATFSRYVEDKDGRRHEIFSLEAWQELCERHSQNPNAVVTADSVVVLGAQHTVVTEAAPSPPEPLTTLIGVYALAGGDMEALIQALHSGDLSREEREEIRKCVEGRKKTDKKDGLRVVTERLAKLVCGGEIAGAPPPGLSAVEHDAACYITQLRDEGRSDEEVLPRLRNHRMTDGSELTAHDVSRLGNLRLRYPQT
jgi:hypothetical protein